MKGRKTGIIGRRFNRNLGKKRDYGRIRRGSSNLPLKKKGDRRINLKSPRNSLKRILNDCIKTIISLIKI